MQTVNPEHPQIHPTLLTPSAGSPEAASARSWKRDSVRRYRRSVDPGRWTHGPVSNILSTAPAWVGNPHALPGASVGLRSESAEPWAGWRTS